MYEYLGILKKWDICQEEMKKTSENNTLEKNTK